MKILHVADLHLDHEWLDWVANQLPDLLIIAGDIQNAFSSISMWEQAKALTRWLEALEVPTVVCSGNHDYWGKSPNVSVDTGAAGGWIRQLAGRGKVLAVDGQRVDFSNISIYVNGWNDVPALKAHTDIVVSHAPPSGCLCATGTFTEDCGDPFLWNAVERHNPRLILGGHAHSPKDYWCKLRHDGGTALVLVPGFGSDADTPNHWWIHWGEQRAVHSLGDVVDFGAEGSG